MNILIAGIPRSGSLRLFNIVRLGLEQLFPKNEINYGYEDKHSLEAKRFNILKVHSCSDKWVDWADVVFTTKRDLRDILASSLDFGMLDKRFLSEERIGIFLRDIIEKYDFWKQHSDLEVVYENYGESKKQVITRIFDILKLKVDVEEILKKLDFLTRNKGSKELVGEYITKTHISENSGLSYKERLDEESLLVVNEVFGEWIKMNGYQAN